MVVKENGAEVKFFIESDANTEHVKELLIFVDGNTDSNKSEVLIVSLLGDINLNEIYRLSSKMNIPGAEHLNKKN